MSPINLAIKKQVLKIIFKYIPKDNCIIFLFGSLAKNEVYPVRDLSRRLVVWDKTPKASDGRQRRPISNGVYPSSDIDIGLISDEPLENSILVKIKQELEQVKTLRDIDIIDFLSIQDKDFLKIALREVKIWHQTLRSKAYLDNLRKLIAD